MERQSVVYYKIIMIFLTLTMFKNKKQNDKQTKFLISVAYILLSLIKNCKTILRTQYAHYIIYKKNSN